VSIHPVLKISEQPKLSNTFIHYFPVWMMQALSTKKSNIQALLRTAQVWNLTDKMINARSAFKNFVARLLSQRFGSSAGADDVDARAVDT
jgi:hypothetical protein